MGNIYGNKIPPETLPNLDDHLSDNKENIQQIILPETLIIALEELTKQLSENLANSSTTTSAIDDNLPELIMPISQNLIASESIIDLTPDTQHDSDISIVNSPIVSKRPKPVIIDLTLSQPEFDQTFMIQQPTTASPSLSSRFNRKRKQNSILEYAVKSPRFSTIFPIKNEILDTVFDEEVVEESNANDLIEYQPYSPLLSEEVRCNPIEEEEEEASETIEELGTMEPMDMEPMNIEQDFSQNLLVSSAETDEIDPSENFLCSENMEMPFCNSENFSTNFDYQLEELNSFKANESEIDSL